MNSYCVITQLTLHQPPCMLFVSTVCSGFRVTVSIRVRLGRPYNASLRWIWRCSKAMSRSKMQNVEIENSYSNLNPWYLNLWRNISFFVPSLIHKISPSYFADILLVIASSLWHTPLPFPWRTVLKDCWQFHYVNYPAGRETFGVKVNKILEETEIYRQGCSTLWQSCDRLHNPSCAVFFIAIYFHQHESQ